jgi:hypothetical protein
MISRFGLGHAAPEVPMHPQSGILRAYVLGESSAPIAEENSNDLVPDLCRTHTDQVAALKLKPWQIPPRTLDYARR